jgi:hypothetical protein
VKSVLQILIITSTHNGFLSNYSWYNKNSDKAEDISTVALFEKREMQLSMQFAMKI